MGESTYGTVVFGDEDAEPLLGVTALESVGIEIDPHNQTMTEAAGGSDEGWVQGAVGVGGQAA